MDPDNAIALLICLVIFVFDPLAMLMTISTNVAIEDYQKKKAAAKAEKEAKDTDDEDVFRGKGWPPIPVDEKFDDGPVDPVTFNPVQLESYNPLARDEVLTTLPPSDGPEKTGNWAIDRYNEDYWEPDVKVEPEVMEHGSEETKPEPEETEPVFPDWVNQLPKFEFREEPEPVIIEQEEVKPLNEEPVYEMGEAKPLNEEPVYEMQQLEEVSPIQEIKQIAEEIEQKPELSQEEQEMRDMIKRFFARQDLVRSTRRD